MRVSKITRTIPDGEYTEPIVAAMGAALAITIVVVVGTITLLLTALGYVLKKIASIIPQR